MERRQGRPRDRLLPGRVFAGEWRAVTGFSGVVRIQAPLLSGCTYKKGVFLVDDREKKHLMRVERGCLLIYIFIYFTLTIFLQSHQAEQIP